MVTEMQKKKKKMLYVQVSGGNPRGQTNADKHHNPIFTTILPRHIFTMPELSLQHGQGREKHAAESSMLTFMSFNQMHETLAFPIAIYFIPQINNVSMHWLVISKESLLWWITYHVAFECAGVA